MTCMVVAWGKDRNPSVVHIFYVEFHARAFICTIVCICVHM